MSGPPRGIVRLRLRYGCPLRGREGLSAEHLPVLRVASTRVRLRLSLWPDTSSHALLVHVAGRGLGVALGGDSCLSLRL